MQSFGGGRIMLRSSSQAAETVAIVGSSGPCADVYKWRLSLGFAQDEVKAKLAEQLWLFLGILAILAFLTWMRGGPLR